jgi:sugar lactone lactonase YvrE
MAQAQTLREWNPKSWHMKIHCFTRAGAALLLATLAASSRADILYVANESNDTIERFSSTGGDLGTFAQNPSSGAAAFGLAFDSATNLYVAYGNLSKALAKFSTNGTLSFSFAPGLGYAEGLAFDRAGNLYAASATENLIEKFSTAGADLGPFATNGLSAPRGIAFDSAGNLYAANSGNNTIEKFSPDGTDLGAFASSASAPLSWPQGLAFDGAGNLYVANLLGNSVEKLSPTGTDMGAFATKGVNAPEGLAFDSAGNLYVANQGGSAIAKFTPDGAGSVFATNGVDGPTFLAFTDDTGKPLPLPTGAGPARPRIDVVPPFTNGQFRVRITGTPGTNYTVQATDGLKSPTNSWTSLFTSNSLSGAFEFLDLQATNPVRFYRALSQ